MKLTLFIKLLFIIFVSCKKEQAYQPVQISCNLTKDLDSCRALIGGTWTWLETKIPNPLYGRDDYIRAKTEGYTRSISVINDTVRFYRNNRPDSVYTYKILKLTELTGTNYPEDNYPVLVFYQLHSGRRYDFVFLNICREYLYLDYESRRHGGYEIWKKQ